MSSEVSLDEGEGEGAGRARRAAAACARAACSQLGLVLLVVLYVVGGAFLFEYLESGPHVQKRSAVQRSRDECLRELWAITERLNVLYERNWTRLVHEQLRKFETSIVTAARAAHDPAAHDPAAHDPAAHDPAWSFSGALLYCITLITTIGYGGVSPRTAAGRAATVAYAAGGVPLALACLAGLGAALARLVRAGWRRAAGRGERWSGAEMENHFQLHEQQRLLPSESNQYTSLPCSPRAPRSPRAAHPPCGPRSPRSPRAARAPRPPGTVCARAGDRGQYSQVFERAPPRAASPHPPSPRAATLGRRRAASDDEPQTSSSLQTQTLDRRRGPPAGGCAGGGHAGGGCSDGGRGGGGCAGGGHGGRLPRPRGAAVEQLIAEECGDMYNRMDELDDFEDPDDGVCAHDTPSRVPLIWKEEKPPARRVTERVTERVTSCVTGHGGHMTEGHVPAGAVLALLAGYVCAGAALFSIWEDWSFLDAAYFCFIALATIGFGDLVPSSLLTRTESRGDYAQMVACCLYLVFGLVLVAMAFSLLQDEVVTKCSQVANTLGLSK